MTERYEYVGRELDTPIIRDILTNKLPLPLEWWSTKVFKETVIQYHRQNGGLPPELVNPHSAVYGVLCRLESREILESYKERVNRYFRVPSDAPNPVERLLRVISQERERIDEVIETLNQRKELLDTILSEYE